MNGHESKGHLHGTSLAYVPSPFTRDQLSPQMQQRYGMDRRPIGRYVVVAILMVAFAAVLVMAGYFLTRPPTSATLITWKVVSPHRVDLTYSVERPTNRQVICVIRAQDDTHVDVGYATVALAPAGDADIHDFALATIAPAATVEILGCALDQASLRVTPPQFPPGVVPPAQPAT